MSPKSNDINYPLVHYAPKSRKEKLLDIVRSSAVPFVYAASYAVSHFAKIPYLKVIGGVFTTVIASSIAIGVGQRIQIEWTNRRARLKWEAQKTKEKEQSKPLASPSQEQKKLQNKEIKTETKPETKHECPKNTIAKPLPVEANPSSHTRSAFSKTLKFSPKPFSTPLLPPKSMTTRTLANKRAKPNS